MMKYTDNMNAAIAGQMNKCFGDGSGTPKKGMTPSKRCYMMKLARYLSRSIHGK